MSYPASAYSHSLWFFALPTVWILLLTGTALGQGYQGIEEKLPRTVDPQPIPFSHKQHASTGLLCSDCHRYANKSERAGLPNTEQCMLCHQTIKTESAAIQKLAVLHNSGKAFEWIRVYTVPDFVFFSHKSHTSADINCVDCHGHVEKRDLLRKEVSTSMTMCMTCHEKMNISRSCHLCHELGQ